MVWSGDLASSGGEDDRFIVPEEGAMIWTDNMLIPKGAANKYTAELMMNYVYDPKIAAQIAAYVYYVSPVKGAAEEIKALDAEAATNPLLFPTPEIVAKQHNFQALSPEQEDKLNELYADLSGRLGTDGATRPMTAAASRPGRGRRSPACAAGCPRRRAVAPARAGAAVAVLLLRPPVDPDVHVLDLARGRSRRASRSPAPPTPTSRR